MAFQTTSPNPPSESIASGRLSPPLEHGVVYAEHRRNEEGHQLHRSPQLYARDSKEEAEADQAASTLLSLDNETTEEAPRTKSIQRISLGQDLVDNWKWELAACIFSAACFLAIALVLATQANKPLANWNLAVSPNATISFSATLATSAFLMVLSAILSQLKWIHFTGHAHSLDQLEHFDLAGRGPLGSLMFLAKYHHGTLLPSFASLLVLICLFVGPFVQLVLSFPTLTLPDPNVEQASFSTATLYDPDNYISDPWDGVGFQAGYTDTRMEAAVIEGLFEQPSTTQLHCPTHNCTWTDVTTLGVCGTCTNITTEVHQSCGRRTPLHEPELTCDFTMPSGTIIQGMAEVVPIINSIS